MPKGMGYRYGSGSGLGRLEKSRGAGYSKRPLNGGYGKKKGEKVFYASQNTVKGTHRKK